MGRASKEGTETRWKIDPLPDGGNCGSETQAHNSTKTAVLAPSAEDDSSFPFRQNILRSKGMSEYPEKMEDTDKTPYAEHVFRQGADTFPVYDDQEIRYSKCLLLSISTLCTVPTCTCNYT